jgi:hypothetical protein
LSLIVEIKCREPGAWAQEREREEYQSVRVWLPKGKNDYGFTKRASGNTAELLIRSRNEYKLQRLMMNDDTGVYLLWVNVGARAPKTWNVQQDRANLMSLRFDKPEGLKSGSLECGVRMKKANGSAEGVMMDLDIALPANFKAE